GKTIEKKGYVLDPHSAIGVAASLRELHSQEHISRPTPIVSLATAHPAKFAGAVELALSEERDFDFASVLPEQFVGLEKLQKKVIKVERDAGLAGIRDIITEEVEREK
ncbi:MAG: threonine synthase, partial [Watsoniomyces obsoletus]